MVMIQAELGALFRMKEQKRGARIRTYFLTTSLIGSKIISQATSTNIDVNEQLVCNKCCSSILHTSIVTTT